MKQAGDGGGGGAVHGGRPTQRPLLGIGLRVAAMSSFAVTAAAIKLGIDYGANTVELIFYRNFIALPVVVLWLMLGPGLHSIRTRRPKAHAVRAALGLASMVLVFNAFILLPLAEATAISFSAPFFSTILSALILKERIGMHRWVAIAIGFVGVLIVMQPWGNSIPLLGLAAAIGSALSVASVTITIRQIGNTETVGATVFWFTLTASVVLGLLMPFFAQPHSLEAWGVILVLGLMGGLAQILMTASLRFAPVSVVAPFDYSQLPWAIGLGWLLWATIPSPMTIVGALLIVATGLYTVYRERRAGQTIAAPATSAEP